MVSMLGVGGIAAAVVSTWGNWWNAGYKGGTSDPMRLLHSERQIRHWYVRRYKISA